MTMYVLNPLLIARWRALHDATGLFPIPVLADSMELSRFTTRLIFNGYAFDDTLVARLFEYPAVNVLSVFAGTDAFLVAA